MKKRFLWMLAAILTTGLTLTSCTDKADNPADSGTTPQSDNGNIMEPSDFASYMDMKTYAGDDFYQYAVGKWLADNPLTGDEKSNGTNAQQSVNADNFLLSLEKRGDSDEVLKYLIDAYDTGSQQADLKVLREKLATIDAVKSRDEMWPLMGTLMLEGYMTPYNVGTDVDQHIVGVFLDLPYRVSHYSLPVKLVASYGDMQAADAQKIISLIDRWKNMLVEEGISKPATSRLTPHEREIHKRGLPRLTRGSSSETALDIIIDKMNLGDEETLGAKSYKEINTFLESLTLDELKYFCKYAVINRDTYFIPNPETNLRTQLYALANTAYSPMAIRFSSVYNKTIPEANRTAALEMAKLFRDVFKERVEKRTWMSAGSKAKAIEKVDAMSLSFGWPDDDSNRSTWAVKVPAGKLSFYQAVCDLFKQNIEIMRSKKGTKGPAESFYANELDQPAYTSNAFYSANNNEILIVSSNLVPPIFDASRSAAINYAVLGATTIGHEMTHGFDTKGKNYDKDGKEEGWMLPEDTLAFNTLADKVIAHFDKQTFGNGYSCDGKLTVGENIADLGGLYIGYDAFCKYLDRQGITGTERDRQLREYFRAFAYAWMGNIDNGSITDYITDVHALPPLRVNGNVYQLNEFYRLFNIKSGKRYIAPEKRIEIW